MAFIIPDGALLVQITTASIAAPMYVATPTVTNIGSLNSGRCRELTIDESTGDLAIRIGYYKIFNAGSALSVDDIVWAAPLKKVDGTKVLDSNGIPVLVSITDSLK